jgi:hypothetical protein
MWHIPLPFATWCSPHAYDMNESLPHRTVVYNLQVLHMHSGITQSDCMSWTCMCLIPLRFSTWCVPPVWLLLLRHGINPDVQHYKSDRCPPTGVASSIEAWYQSRCATLQIGPLSATCKSYICIQVLCNRTAQHGYESEACYGPTCALHHSDFSPGACHRCGSFY